MITQVVTPQSNRTFVEADAWDRLVRSLRREHSLDLTLAERILDQTIGALRLCAIEYNSGNAPKPGYACTLHHEDACIISTEGVCILDPEHTYSIPELIDLGLHTFILDTPSYFKFCMRIAGRYIHHVPADEHTEGEGTADTIRTVAAMKRHGIPVDELLWVNSRFPCSMAPSGPMLPSPPPKPGD